MAEPVLFSLEVQIAEPGDPVDDPSAAWPRGRRRVIVGTLKVTGPDIDRDQQMAYVTKTFTRLKQIGTTLVVFGSGGARQVPGNPRVAFSHVYGAPGLSACTLLTR